MPHSPEALPKILTGPELLGSRLVQTCCGMRRFTEFRLCPIRARCIPVSAHLSFCRNFATAHAQAKRAFDLRFICAETAAQPICMHVQHDWSVSTLAPASRAIARKTVPQLNGPYITQPRRARIVPCSIGRIPKTLTFVLSVRPVEDRRTPQRMRDPLLQSPEKPHLLKKPRCSRHAARSRKVSPAIRRGRENANGFRYLRIPVRSP